MSANILNAGSWPFHVLDCHMRNHSPPTAMNAKYHWMRLAVRPTEARTLAAFQSAVLEPPLEDRRS